MKDEEKGKIDKIAALYYQEVGRYSLPTKEEEVKSFTQYQTMREREEALEGRGRKAEAAKVRVEKDKLGQKLACWYVRFVINMARKKTRDAQLLQELISEGNIGLMIGIRRFDVNRKVRFLTYAAWWIHVHMQEHLKRIDHVHISNQVRKDIKKQKQEEEKLFAAGVITQSSVVEPTISPIDPNVHACEDSADEGAMRDEQDMLRRMGRVPLTELERLVLVYHFGLRDGAGKTFSEISQLLWEIDGSMVPSDKVRAAKDRAVAVLRDHLASENINSSSDLL